MKTSHEILHGISLKNILEILVDTYEFDGLDSRLKMNCFHNNPSIKSSLNFLRKTPWARTKVEGLYVEMINNKDK